MEQKEMVVVVDFGGQYNQLIARRVRENNVYCEVYPYNKALEKIKELQPKGIIFTGGPASVYEDSAPKMEAEVFELLWYAIYGTYIRWSCNVCGNT